MSGIGTKPVPELSLADFEAALEKAGYAVAGKSMEPSMVLDDHTHDFDVHARVTAGAISITIDGRTARYGVGDEFIVAAGTVHSESVGDDGVTFIAGRRAP